MDSENKAQDQKHQPIVVDEEMLANCTDAQVLEWKIIKSEEKVSCPLTHIFTPGLYTRKIFMPSGSLIVSATHKTRHPFIVTEGEVDVITPNGTESIVGPYMGITDVGTKRFLYIKKDTTWVTFHANPTNISDADEIAEHLMADLDNPLLDGKSPECRMWSNDVSDSITINAID
jgi:hypothetical protein